MIAFPLIPLLGIVATFNVLVISSGVAAAYSMFLCARRLTGDTAASWVAGLAFGFSPFMSARATEHFSLIQTAPLPLFVMLFERLHFRPTFRVAAAAGITVACALLCDPYYAVYCLLIGAFAIAYSAVLIRRGPLQFRPYRGALALDVVLVCLAGLIAGMLVGGGRRIEIFTIRISMTRLYTPILLFTVLALARLWLVVRPRVSWVFPTRLPSLRAMVVAGAAWAGRGLPRYWIAFTALFASLALGPFIRVGGVMTYVPTPWTLLRYLPVIGAARMPPRMMVLVMLGLSVLLAFALRELRGYVRHHAAFTAVVAGALIFEMLPAPRVLHSAEVPSVNRIIAADPRPVRVVNLPFGLRDGLSSHGNANAAGQYFQTVHEKQLLGGYMSRLPRRKVQQYRRFRVTRVLMDLSEGRPVSPWRKQAAIEQAHEFMPTLAIGYVVVKTDSTSAELLEFSRAAFDLTSVASDGPYVLYRTPLASPPDTPASPQNVH